MKRVFWVLVSVALLGLVFGCGGKKEEAAKQETQQSMEQPAASTMVKDVVCKMDVDTTKTVIKATYEGETYYFCSEECKTKFEANPAEYVMHEEGEHKEGEHKEGEH